MLSQSTNTKANDVLIDLGGWNWDYLSLMLPPHICAKIAAVPPPLGLFDSNILVWLPSSNGNFSVKSAYISISLLDGAMPNFLYKFGNGVV